MKEGSDIEIATMAIQIDNIEKTLVRIEKELKEQYMVRHEAMNTFLTRAEGERLEKGIADNGRKIDRAYIVFGVIMFVVNAIGIPLGFYLLNKFF